jgi:hypothetical protein
VGDRVIGRARAAALLVAWTLALALGLRGVDRWIAGAPPPRDWLEAARLEEVPAAAGLPSPSYIPGHLAWPPRRILYRADRAAGSWIGVAERGGRDPVLWIGASRAAPPALGALAGCLGDRGRAACPAGWHTLSRALPDRRPLFVLTSLDAGEARRVLEGLELAHH